LLRGERHEVARDGFARRREDSRPVPLDGADERAHQAVVPATMAADATGSGDALGLPGAVVVNLHLGASLVGEEGGARPVDADGAAFDVRRPLHREADRETALEAHEHDLMIDDVVVRPVHATTVWPGLERSHHTLRRSIERDCRNGEARGILLEPIEVHARREVRACLGDRAAVGAPAWYLGTDGVAGEVRERA